MASTLHYITPLALADTFNEWFLRSNDMIDVVNKLNVYDVDTGMGLAKYRAVDGTTKIRINIGQGPNEYAGNISGVTGHGNYGLRFLAIGAGGQTLGDVGTGAANPDVSGDPAILTLDIVGLSGGSGGESGAVVSKDDYFVFADNDHPLQLSYKVAAENMLPYAISGDHRFSGNILFDGDVTTINSSEVYIDDKVIWLATSITGDHSFGGSNDAGLEGAGFVIKGRSDTSDKEFVLDYPSSLADPSSFVSFKPNIDLNFETARALTNSAFTILAHKSAGNVELRLSSLAQLGKHYEFAAFQSGDNQSRLKIRHENTISGVSQDAISVTPLGTVQVHKLSGDVLDGGVTYENTFSWEPKSDGIPTSYSGTPNDKLLNYKWVNRKLVSQTAHGLSQGHLIKFYQNGTLAAGAGSTYEKATATSRAGAEVVAIVEETPVGACADQFIAVYSGLVDLAGASFGDGTGITTNIATGNEGFTLMPGEAYFLNGTNGPAGGFTSADPLIPGEIRKPILVGVSDTVGMFVNYAGFEIGQTTGISSDFLDVDLITQNMTRPDFLPQSTFRNKIVNGDFDFWQRWEHTLSSGTKARDTNKLFQPAPTGLTYDGVSCDFAAGKTGYHADQWLIAPSHRATDADNTSTCTVSRFGLTQDVQIFSNGGAKPVKNFIQVVKNTALGDGNVVLAQRIEDVRTLARSGTENDVVVSYWARQAGVSAHADNAGCSFGISLYQVFQGTSGAGLTYGGGATSASGIFTNGTIYEHGHTHALSTSWTRYEKRFKTRAISGFSGSGAGISAEANWLELRFFLDGAGAGISSGFNLTRVQLEAGANATRFEERPLQIEKQLCKRYYNIITAHANQFAVSSAVIPTMIPLDIDLYPIHGFSAEGINCAAANRNIVMSIDMTAGTDLAAAALTDVKSIGGRTQGIHIERTGDSATAADFHTHHTLYHIDTSIH